MTDEFKSHILNMFTYMIPTYIKKNIKLVADIIKIN